MSVKHPIRVLIVDDSAYMRKVLREMLENSPYVEVVGTAWDGQDALDQIVSLQPEVITVDLHMPGMDGAELIRALMERGFQRIVVVSSTTEGSTEFMAAMEAGAVEFVTKPTAMALEKMYSIRQELVQAVMTAASIQTDHLPRLPVSKSKAALVVEAPKGLGKSTRIDAVVIGISTGGPRALRTMIPRFPAEMPVPVVVVLHMPVGYTKLLSEQLNELSQVEVLESTDNIECKPGRVIIAQAGMHTRLHRYGDGRVVTMVRAEPVESLYCPSVDELFQSAAETYHGRLLAVVMTGMGNDGTNGAGWIKSQGGLIFAESEETSVVFGMPRAVIEAGLVDRIVPLDRMPEAIMEVFK